MKLHFWLFGILAIALSSCGSGYVVSSNAFAPKAGEKSHYTPNGTLIPKASNSYENQFRVDPNVEPVQLESDVLQSIELPEVAGESKAISYTAYALLDEAKTYLGTPYRYGGTSRRGIDCSAFTQRVFSAHNIHLPRVARSQAKEGTYISKGELQKGDLIFFITRGSYISHVGIVDSVNPDGEVMFIHASSSQGVTISSLNSAYWSRRFKYGRRVI